MRKTSRHITSIVIVLVAVAVLSGVILVTELEPKLGLDLRGGLALTLTAPAGTRDDVLDKTVEVLRARVDALGVAEPDISREGSTNVLIQVPGTSDRARLLDLIGRTAQLQFRQVKQVIPEGDPAFVTGTVVPSEDPAAEAILPDAEGSTQFRLGPVELTGAGVQRASAIVDTGAVGGGWRVDVEFDKTGADKWKEFTGRLACLQGPERQIAIILDDRVESSPQVGEEVQCNDGLTDTVITGGFTEKEAKDLALVLTTGALPVKLERSEVRTVSPTLGSDSLRAGLLGGALGLALVLLYVLIYYRTLGLQTWLGLLAFSSLIYSLIVLFGAWIGWNLTLAGIAGLMVSVGVATDSYIVFFERVKEEVHEGRSLPASVDRGFKHAWRTMRTANTVTILAAVVLYFLAVGPVRGFALALGMATLLDLAVTYALTWPLAALLARSRFFAEGRFIGMRRALEGKKSDDGKTSVLTKIYRSEFNIDFIGKRKLWMLISGVLVSISVLALIPGLRGLTYGIDFKGGTLLRSPRDTSVSIPEMREALSIAGVENPVVQVVGDFKGRSEFQIQSEELEGAELDKTIAAVASANKVDENQVDTESVGQKWGQQITTKALRGLAIFILLVILYMSWRLEPKMALAGIMALLHDLLLTAGVYAIVGFEVTPATVIATLTILGYSLYDTVVVFDKIRENQALPAYAKKSFAEISNASTNQVFMRSINTSLTVLLPVGSLLFVSSFLLGAETLKDLSLALFVGVAASTYSSVFVATPLLSFWKEKESRYAGLRPRMKSQTVPLKATPAPVTAQGEGAAAAPAASRPKGPTTGDHVVRAQRKKQSRSKRKKKRR
ncbi:MAG TPA: protein translocase subunit SecD [Actinomycetota bacterium]|nr:protein translocase subunit SecD [Actinomycetota bacterium]